MKLWYSFFKELKLSSKSWYFYIELGMAIILLLVLIFIVPEDFNSKGKDYLYLDLPETLQERYKKNLLEEDIDEMVQQESIEVDEVKYESLLYETNQSKIYLLSSLDALTAVSESEGVPVIHVHINEENQIVHTYYLQGYETQKLRNLLLVYYNRFAGKDVVQEYTDNIKVKQLYQKKEPLSDKENMVPVFLTFNGSLMSLFIIAAYVFLDKDEGIIKAYAITASSVWHYLVSKIGVIIVTSLITSLIITIPVMGLQPNYLLLILFIVTSGFFAAALGLLITSYYNDIVEAFGVMYIIIVIMIMPNISYFTPSWDPNWVKIIPSYVMLQSFKEIISIHGNQAYVLTASLGFFTIGVSIFILANYRFKKTLTL